MKKFKKQEDHPSIYLRYLNNSLVYIGETKSWFSGRPFRIEERNEYDKVILIKASKCQKRRKYWEAYLICKLKPLNQNSLLYKAILNPHRKNKKQNKDLQEKMTDRIFHKKEAVTAYENFKYHLLKLRTTA